MRVSGIENYLGGADNVQALSYLQGEQLKYTGTVEDENSNAINITNYTISARAEFFKGTVKVQSGTAQISSLVDNTETGVVDVSLTVTKTDEANGKFQLVIPSTFYAPEVPIDATTEVPIGVVYLRFSDGASTPEIRESRMVIIIRRAKYS